jgi:hypothetical protein
MRSPLPLAVALTLAVTVSSAWVLFAYLFLAGADGGIRRNHRLGGVGRALRAPKRGRGPERCRRGLGPRRATSPVVFGRLLDAGYVFKDILTGSLVLLLVASVLAAVGCCSGFLAGTQGERSPELRA